MLVLKINFIYIAYISMLEKINKPWGYYQILDSQNGYQLKKLFVNPKSKLSLQSHKYRSEHWVVLYGQATVTIDKNVYELSVNESIYIPMASKHRLENNTDKELVVGETQIGDYLGEDDIIRYKDIYKREITHDN